MNKIRHTGIAVTDIEKSIHFYRDLMGLEIIKDMEESGEFIDLILAMKDIKVRTVKMKDINGNLIELLYFRSHLEKPKEIRVTKIGCTHIAFTVKNIDELYKKLKENKIKFNSSPKISPNSQVKVVFCRDPDGVFIELVEELKK